MIHGSIRWFVTGCVVTLSLLVVAIFAQEAKLSPCQAAQADVLQLRQANAELRRTVVSLQVQIEQLRAPGDQQAIDAGWKALEKDLGCAIDRQTRECRPEKKETK